MGQLERYGLYVLCLVIFLILGVAIWGSDPQELRRQTLLNVDQGGGVKTQEDHRRDVLSYRQEQARNSISKYKAAQDAVFNAAEDPGPAVASAQSVPKVEIRKADVPAPAQESVTEHIIAPGDNFSSLAQSYLNDANLYHRIAAANPKLDPKHLQPGMKVVIPKRPVGARKGAKRAVAAAVSGATHRVREGESPWRIAEKYVGAGKAHAYSQRIIKLNGLSSRKQLSPGDVIKLPSR